MQATFVWFIIGTTCIVQSSTAYFGYKKRQQHVWPRKFKECGGKMQSPITLSTSKSIALPLPALEMVGFHDFLPHPLTLINNGHSVALNVVKNSTHRRLPYIFGAMLNENQQYELEGLHFHWGNKNNRGSEHVLNDIRYSMEMHIIHRNIAYSNMEHASAHADGLVVLGIFFQVQDSDNDMINPILKYLPSIQWINTGMTRFRMLSNGEDKLGDNFRKLQNIGRRKVYVRNVAGSKIDLVDLNFTNFIWFDE
ncbi:hypothetical protein PV328_011127 [Microctonus aethiopoides]|uniref:Carbonic anhydrase n=1 Tax=Microctonus aethiopoides TaxID=144406 RepID=A0AA39EV50_9HYME|nr:hypothetical protein PV328_011127 [Microctonus aethiopoides]